MARKRVVEPSGVKTWEDANDALRQIVERSSPSRTLRAR